MVTTHKRRTTAFLLGILLIALYLTPAHSEDWPYFAGRYRRNISEEKRLPDSFVPGERDPSTGEIDLGTAKNVRWIAHLCPIAFGTPTVADGRIFVGTNNKSVDDPRFGHKRGGVLNCLDEATGKMFWQLVAPNKQTGLPKGSNISAHNWGICASPTVDGERVYVTTNRCDVLCVDVHGLSNGNDGPFKDEAQYMAGFDKPPIELSSTDADIVWVFDMIDELSVAPHDAVSSSVLVDGDFLYVNTSNGEGIKKFGHTGPYKAASPFAPSLIVLEKQTGRLVATDDEKIGLRIYHGQWSSPAIGEVGERKLILFGGGDGVCYAFEAVSKAAEEPVRLRKVWSYDCNPDHYRFRDSEPIPYIRGDIRHKWEFKEKGNKNDGNYVGPSQIIATPVFYDNRVYVAIGQDPAHGRGKGMLHCIDATKNGDITQTGRIWTYDGIQRSVSTVAVADGLVYASDIAGVLHCLDAESGECYWTHETKHETWGGPMVADNKVYLTTKKSFWILEAGKQKKVISHQRGLGSEAPPIAANGVLYALLKGHLYALKK